MDKNITCNKTSAGATEEEPSYEEVMAKLDKNTRNATLDEVMNAPYNKSFYEALEKYGLNLEELKSLPVTEAMAKSAYSDAYRKYVVGTLNKFAERYLVGGSMVAFNEIMPKIVFSNTNDTPLKNLDCKEVVTLMSLLFRMCSSYINENPEIQEHHEFVTVFENAVETTGYLAGYLTAKYL